MHSDNLKKLYRYVARYRRKVIALRILQGLVVAGGIFGTAMILLQIAFALFPWTMLPAIAAATAGAAGIFMLSYGVRIATVKAPDILKAARMIESSVKTTGLSIALELASDKRTAKNPFTHHALSRAVSALPALPERPRITIPARLVALAALTIAVSCTMHCLLSPRLLDYWNLPFMSGTETGIVVSPGSVMVPQNTSVIVRLAPDGRYPSCRLLLCGLGNERQEHLLLRPDSSGAFSCRLDSLKTSRIYRFRINNAQTADTITVVPTPRLSRVNVTVIPPAYTRLPRRVLGDGEGSFEALNSSRALVSIQSAHFGAGWLVCGRDSVPLTKNGAAVSCGMTVSRSGDYTFALIDTFGQKSDSLPVFHISCIDDEAPMVRIVKPGYSRSLEPAQVETLTVEGVDDIGVAAMSIRYDLHRETGSGTSADSGKSLGAFSAPFVSASYVWHLSGLSLYPGDSVYYWAEILDSRQPHPQRAVSDTFWFRIPDFSEIHRQLALREAAAVKSLGAVRGEQKKMAERLSTMSRSSRDQSPSWEQKEAVSEMRSALAAQADSLRASLAALRQNVEIMKREGTVGAEVAKKLEEVRRAVEELVRLYGDELLSAESQAPVSAQEMLSAIDRVSSMLPKLGEQLDNVLKVLELLRQDRKLGELAMRAEKLSADQLSAAKALANSGTLSRQSKLLDDIQKLSGDIASLDNQQAPPSLPALDSLMREMQNSGQPSPQQMSKMGAALASLSQELLQMMNFSMARRQEKDRERLITIADEALSLADWQDETGRAAGMTDRARSQQALRDALKKCLKTADSLSALPPADMLAIGGGFRQALAASDAALGDLSHGDGGKAMSRSSAALRSLGNGALNVLSGLDKGQSQCSGGSCMMPGLRRASGRQAAINAMTGELLRGLFGSSQGGSSLGGTIGSSPESQAARREAQKAQQALADDLKKLQEKFGREAGDDMSAKVKQLEDEARSLGARLERPSPDIAGEQDKFLMRMLETSLSMHRQDEGKDEWQSQSAAITYQEGPESRPAGFSRDADSFHRLRQRAFSGSFPAAYRQSVVRYFDTLGERFLNQNRKNAEN